MTDTLQKQYLVCLAPGDALHLGKSLKMVKNAGAMVMLVNITMLT